MHRFITTCDRLSAASERPRREADGAGVGGGAGHRASCPLHLGSGTLVSVAALFTSGYEVEGIVATWGAASLLESTHRSANT